MLVSGDEGGATVSRRGLLATAGAAVAATVLADRPPRAGRVPGHDAVRVAFRGPHQAGIATPQQQHAVVIAYDVTGTGAASLAVTLRRWSRTAERLTAGLPVNADSDETLDLGPARLTLTVGFGRTLFSRTGMPDQRPAALETLPRFRGDALQRRWCGGDLVVQSCADDPQVALHAVRTLSRIGHPTVRPRWLQSGFLPTSTGTTPRNLFGFADGTANIQCGDTSALETHVWVAASEPAWMHGGSYLVIRRIRMDLEKWDASSVHEQESAIGRSKLTGRRLPSAHTGHATLARPQANGGVRLLRRGYAFSDGLDRGGRLDAGLLFLAYQRDPRKQFTPIQHRLAAHDAMTEYTRHVGSALFACPPGVVGEGWWGEALFT